MQTNQHIDVLKHITFNDYIWPKIEESYKPIIIDLFNQGILQKFDINNKDQDDFDNFLTDIQDYIDKQANQSKNIITPQIQLIKPKKQKNPKTFSITKELIPLNELVSITDQQERPIVILKHLLNPVLLDHFSAKSKTFNSSIRSMVGDYMQLYDDFVNRRQYTQKTINSLQDILKKVCELYKKLKGSITITEFLEQYLTVQLYIDQPYSGQTSNGLSEMVYTIQEDSERLCYIKCNNCKIVHSDLLQCGFVRETVHNLILQGEADESDALLDYITYQEYCTRYNEILSYIPKKMLRVFVQDNHKIYLGVIYDPITKTFMIYIGLESGSGIDWYRRDVHIADVQKEGNKQPKYIFAYSYIQKFLSIQQLDQFKTDTAFAQKTFKFTWLLHKDIIYLYSDQLVKYLFRVPEDSVQDKLLQKFEQMFMFLFIPFDLKESSKTCELYSINTQKVHSKGTEGVFSIVGEIHKSYKQGKGIVTSLTADQIGFLHEIRRLIPTLILNRYNDTELERALIDVLLEQNVKKLHLDKYKDVQWQFRY